MATDTQHPMEGPPLNVAMLAPPWIPVPPPGYGGIEQVVELLAGELVHRGHGVTLFAAPGSKSTAVVTPLLERAHPDAIQIAIFEADHAAHGFDEIEAAAAAGNPFDIVHDHSGLPPSRSRTGSTHRWSTPCTARSPRTPCPSMSA